MNKSKLPFYRTFQIPEAELQRIATAHVREAHKIGFESCIAHSDHCPMCWLIATLERVAVEYETEQSKDAPTDGVLADIMTAVLKYGDARHKAGCCLSMFSPDDMREQIKAAESAEYTKVLDLVSAVLLRTQQAKGEPNG